MAGTFTGTNNTNIVIDSSYALNILSLQGNSDMPIFDAQQQGRILSFSIDNALVGISNLVFKNGNSTAAAGKTTTNFNGGCLLVSGNGSNYTFQSVVFDTCVAQIPLSEINNNQITASGGGMSLDTSTIPKKSSASQAIISNCTFVNCLASSQGGALFVALAFPVVSLQNSTFSNNEANLTAPLTSFGKIVVNHLEEFESKKINVQEEDIINPTSLLMAASDNVGSSNGLPIGTGGGIFAWGLVLNIEGCSFMQNSASVAGGALYLSGQLISESPIKTSQVNITVEDSWFSGNQAVYGGAIFEDSSVIFYQGVGLEQNSALQDGGAVYVWTGPATLPGTDEWVESNFLSNSAQNGRGGAFYLQGPYGQGAFFQCNFTSNQAGQYGGGLMLNLTQNVAVEGSVFTGNSVGMGGGGGGLACWRSAGTNVWQTQLSNNQVRNTSADASVAHRADAFAVDDSCSSMFWQVCPCQGTNTQTDPDEVPTCDSCQAGTCATHDTSNGSGGMYGCYCFYQPACQEWSSDVPEGENFTLLWVALGFIGAGVLLIVAVAVGLFVYFRMPGNRQGYDTI